MIYTVSFGGAVDQELLGEGGDLWIAVEEGFALELAQGVDGAVVAGLSVGGLIPGVADGDVHVPPLTVQVDLIPHMDVVAGQDAGNVGPVTEELEGVGVGHTAAGDYAALGQHLSGTGVFDFISNFEFGRVKLIGRLIIKKHLTFWHIRAYM